MQFLVLADAFEKIENTAGRLGMARLLSSLFSCAKDAQECRQIAYMVQGSIAPAFEGLDLGMGERFAIAAVALCSGASEKRVEDTYKKEGDLGSAAQILLSKKSQMALSQEELSLEGVYSSFVKIAKTGGSGSQQMKIKALAQLLNSASPLEAKYIVRFALATLRLGVGEPTILDSLVQFQINRVMRNADVLRVNGEFEVQNLQLAILEKEEDEEKATDFQKAAYELKLSAEDAEKFSEIASNEKKPEKETGEKTAKEKSTGENAKAKEETGSDENPKAKKKKKLDISAFAKSKFGEVKFTIENIEENKNSFFLHVVFTIEEKKKMREEYERAFNLCSDIGEVAAAVYGKPTDMGKFSMKIFSPVRPALAERLSTAEEIIEKIGECAVEGKYDGLRMQVHRKGERVEIFSRKQERMTHMFPEIVSAAKELGAREFILEGEALAYNAAEDKYYSFQQTIQRKRKHGIQGMSEELPLHLFAFDILYADGVEYTYEEYSKRRNILEKILKGNKTIVPSKRIIAKTAAELEKFFNKCIAEGLEGIIAKDLKQPYIAGARKFAWIKLKRSYGALADSIDVVICGYYLGKGQRSEFAFGGLLTAVYNEESGKFETIAKIGSGFTEVEMGDFEEMLKKITVKEKPHELESELVPDFWTKLKYVISVTADEITLSPMHTCGKGKGEDAKGYALRFPRMVELRIDKGPAETTTVSEIEKMYRMQKK
ncbi:DNA ligase [Candidatus Anstonella stagnisolia]|nr:DNA ligase [Candidatus Anstonella stagnisolia]